MKIYSFVGWSGSGKTTLIVSLIAYFKRKKKSVAALKNAPHHYSSQPEGKDSWKFSRAGADMVFLTSGNEILSIKKRKRSCDLLTELDPELRKFDLVLLEGMIGDRIPIIEVFNSKQNKNLKYKLEKLSAVISDQRIDLTIPWFDLNDIEKIARYMEVLYEQ